MFQYITVISLTDTQTASNEWITMGEERGAVEDQKERWEAASEGPRPRDPDGGDTKSSSSVPAYASRIIWV